MNLKICNIAIKSTVGIIASLLISTGTLVAQEDLSSLAAEPVSMLDFGIYKLNQDFEKQTERFERNLGRRVFEGEPETATILADYDSDRKMLAIMFTIQSENPLRQNDASCNDVLIASAKLSVIELSDGDNYLARMAYYFLHQGQYDIASLVRVANILRDRIYLRLRLNITDAEGSRVVNFDCEQNF